MSESSIPGSYTKVKLLSPRSEANRYRMTLSPPEAQHEDKQYNRWTACV